MELYYFPLKCTIYFLTNVKAGLNFIKDMVEKGRFRPLIDRKYPIDKIAEAYRYVETGQKTGNVIIVINQ